MSQAPQTSPPAVRRRLADAVCKACAAGVSVVCMSSMATALTASAAAAAAGAAGMGDMSSMSGAGSSVLPGLVDAVGLGAINRLPNDLLQPLLMILLGLSVVANSVVSRGSGVSSLSPLLTVSSAALMYTSIYLVMSDALYFLSLVGLVGPALWAMLPVFVPAAPGGARRLSR